MKEKYDLRKEMQEAIEGKSNEEIEKMIKQTKKLMTYYRCAILELETKFKVLNEQFCLEYERNPIESIKTRLKSFESIREKLHRKNIRLSNEAIENNLNDVAGVRVICSFIDDIYMLADCIIKQDDVKLIAIKDYIKKPKSNGYRSLHLIIEIPIFLYDMKKYVKVEVQLRTIAMESWANLEHKLRYKKHLDREKLDEVNARLLECAENCSFIDETMQSIRNKIN